MQTLLLTGGTGNFGRAIIEYFKHSSITLIFTSRSWNKIKHLEKEYSKESINLIGVNIDFNQLNYIDKLLDFLKTKRLDVNYLVNNARSLSSLAVEYDGMTSRKNFLQEYLIDVVIPYELSMRLARKENTHIKGIINISSQYGVVASNPALYTDFEQQSPIQYGVAKAALIHLTRELAVRLANKNIKVNCIAYGGVEGRVDEEFKARYSKLNLIGRMLNEKEIAPPIEFLMSENVAMTGQTIIVDGGWTVC